MSALTQSPMIANLCLPLQQVAVWFSTQNKGHKRPLSNVVFLYAQKTQVLIHFVLSIMVDCVGRPLKGRLVPLPVLRTPQKSATQYISILCVGYSLLQRNHHATK